MTPSFISIGCECGGPEAGFVGTLKVPLYEALARHVSASHCSAVDQYAVVLRVDGALAQYGAEGVARLRFAKKNRYITAYVQIPEAAWAPLSRQELARHIANQVRLTLQRFAARLRADGHDVEEDRLFAEVDAAIDDYLRQAS